MSRFVKTKKSNVTMSLSWVFMIIVGTFFIIISYNIIAKYQANEEIKYQVEVQNTLRNILNNIGRTTGSEKNSLDKLGNIFKDSRVEILCEDGMPILSINDNYDPNNNFLKSYPTFMTYIEQGKLDETYIAVENFRLPFKITNMLALVSKRNLIVMDKNSNFGKKLYKKFEDESSYSTLNYKYEDFTQISQDTFYSGYVKGRNLNSIVFVTDYIPNNPNFNINLEELNVPSYLIQIDEFPDGKSGTIYYTDQVGTNSSYNYTDYDQDLALPTMAVFSSPQTFECSYSLLLKSISSTYGFYINKTQYYLNINDNICLSSYGIFEKNDMYSKLKEALLSVQDEIISENFNNTGVLNSDIEELVTQQMLLEKVSCPYVY